MRLKLLFFILLGLELSSALLLSEPKVRASDDEIRSKIESSIHLLKLGSRQQLTQTDFNQITALPISAIPILTEQLNAVHAGTRDRPLFDLLAIEIGLYEAKLDKMDLSNGVDALLAKTAMSKNEELQEKGFVLSGSNIKDSRIKDEIVRIRSISSGVKKEGWATGAQ